MLDGIYLIRASEFEKWCNTQKVYQFPRTYGLG
jgi:hypothetical protein